MTALSYVSEIKKEEEPSEITTLLFVGDVMLSRDVGKIMEEKSDFTYPFQLIKETLEDTDLLIGNLENPISEKGIKAGSIYSFRAKPQSVEGLSFPGFDVLSLANNHIWDYGKEALLDTFSYLHDAGISYIGAGKDFPEAHTAYITEINGVRFAFLAYTNLISKTFAKEISEPAVAFIDEEVMRHDIERARNMADVVVISFHWGEEYKTVHNNYQEDIAHKAIDFGADLIVGHHSHVVQDVEEYKGRLVVYSVGNFIFDQNFDNETEKGIILKTVFRGRNLEQHHLIPIAFTKEYRPFPLPQ